MLVSGRVAPKKCWNWQSQQPVGPSIPTPPSTAPWPLLHHRLQMPNASVLNASKVLDETSPGFFRVKSMCQMRWGFLHLEVSKKKGLRKYRVALSREWGNDTIHGYDGDSFLHSLLRGSQYKKGKFHHPKIDFPGWLVVFRIHLQVVLKCLTPKIRKDSTTITTP